MRTLTHLLPSSLALATVFRPRTLTIKQPAAPAAPHTSTIPELFQRNVGTPERQRSAFPPHKSPPTSGTTPPGGEVQEHRHQPPSLHRASRLHDRARHRRGVFNHALDEQRKAAVK